ncbi:putative BRCT protein [Trachipleistophora hominis]|uniref:Putative BRCT protein n=1 Tax=Trachipleistophora hominis TaxID=72359 RepID=L7JXN4_TRAHO|nr:putative BRCT protein [Trachipleistophora hominis]
MPFPHSPSNKYDKAIECFMKRLYTFIKCQMCHQNTALYQTNSNKIICSQCKEKGRFKECIFAHMLFDLRKYFVINVFDRNPILSTSSVTEKSCSESNVCAKPESDHTSVETINNGNDKEHLEIPKLSFSLSSYLESSPLKSNPVQRPIRLFTPTNDSSSFDFENFDCPLKPTFIDLPDSQTKTALTLQPAVLSFSSFGKQKKQPKIILKRIIKHEIEEIGNIYMCFSNLNEYQHRYVTKKFPIYKKKYKNIFLCRRMSDQVTHLIVNTEGNKCIRSYKYLYAGLRGIFILNFAFFIDFENQIESRCSWYQFLVDGDLAYGTNSLSTNIFRKDNLIFENVNFIMDKRTTNYQVAKLVQLGGGTINSKQDHFVNITIDHPCEIYDYISSNKKLC